jgi:hypothetical protein
MINIHIQTKVDPNNSMDLFRALNFRSSFTDKYGSAIPPNFTEWEQLLHVIGHNRILSINSGLGYWEHLLQQSGKSVISTDISPPENPFTFVFPLDAVSAVQNFTDVDCLLSIWATATYNNDYVLDALSVFKGKYFILVGEGNGGCTASERLFDELDQHWVLQHRIEHPNFYSIYSVITVYTRL